MAQVLTFLIKLTSILVSFMPRKLQLWVGKILGLTWFYVVRIRRELVFENISKAFPEKTFDEVYKIAKDNYINYGQSFIEFLLIPVLDEKLYKKIALVEGFENYVKASKLNKGVFLLSLHLSSWEFMSAGGILLGIPLNIITKKFKATALNKAWIDLRLSKGLKLIKEEKTSFEILRAIKKGEAVGLYLINLWGHRWE
ncbi:MAG: hypothetical protein IPM57_02165 [Oligoflexia bacterium]|nr:hypothetical protein [Oligoflexia bacterium]